MDFEILFESASRNVALSTPTDVGALANVLNSVKIGDGFHRLPAFTQITHVYSPE